jgi:hypothetical protein
MDKDEQRLRPVSDQDRAAPSPPDFIESLIRPWSRLGLQLVPLIGETGFCALVSRAARVAALGQVRLAIDPSCRLIDKLLAALSDSLAGLDGERAGAANAELLNTFTKLLSALIGEALTTRLLSSASDGDEREQCAQEYK